jgi:hypothetical protein
MACLVGMVSIGCSTNTHSIKIAGAGILLRTGTGLLAIGNFDGHIVTTDLSQEALSIDHTQYYDVSYAGIKNNSGVIGVRSEFNLNLTPVESGTWEGQ